MKTLLTIAILVLTIPAFGQPTSKEIRESLYGQSIRFIDGGWIFQKDELIEIDILSVKHEGRFRTIEINLSTGDAPGLIPANQTVTRLSGQIKLHYADGMLRGIENISLRSEKTPVRFISSVPTSKDAPKTYIPQRRQFTRTLLNKDIVVGSGKVLWQPFSVQTGGNVVGRLEGSGGNRGEFESFIMNDRQLTDFRNGKNVIPFWNSNGPLVVHEISVYLDPGQYYLVLRNSGGWVQRNVIATIVQ